MVFTQIELCYYSDINEFAKNNLDLVEDAISEYGWGGVGRDLHRAAQLAEYDKIYLELLRDRLRIFVNYFIKRLLAEDDKTLEKIEEDQFEEALSQISDNMQRFSEINDIKESLL